MKVSTAENFGLGYKIICFMLFSLWACTENFNYLMFKFSPNILKLLTLNVVFENELLYSRTHRHISLQRSRPCFHRMLWVWTLSLSDISCAGPNVSPVQSCRAYKAKLFSYIYYNIYIISITHQIYWLVFTETWHSKCDTNEYTLALNSTGLQLTILICSFEIFQQQAAV